MPISVSIDSIIQALVGHRRLKHDQIANYLDTIAKDARLLATAWREILDDTASSLERLEIRGGYFSESDVRESIKAFYDRSPPRNITPLHRLEEFYLALSSVIGEHVRPEFHERFNYHLSSLLHQRYLTKAQFDDLRPSFHSVLFVDKNNMETNFERFSDLVVAVDREAAALETLAADYRAQK